MNPPGRFGICFFGCSTYSCLPRPFSDIQVRADGRTRSVEKTHDLQHKHIEWLLDPMPEILIIGIGWDGIVKVDEKIQKGAGCEVRIEKTGKAIGLFNSLKKQKRKVAIHVHSTC